MKHNLGSYLLILFLIFLVSIAQAEVYTVSSPDGRIKVKVEISENISYSVMLMGKIILQPSVISLTLNNEVLGVNPRLKSQSRRLIDEMLHL